MVVVYWTDYLVVVVVFGMGLVGGCIGGIEEDWNG